MTFYEIFIASPRDRSQQNTTYSVLALMKQAQLISDCFVFRAKKESCM